MTKRPDDNSPQEATVRQAPPSTLTTGSKPSALGRPQPGHESQKRLAVVPGAPLDRSLESLPLNRAASTRLRESMAKPVPVV
jgi:hypothetical protein